MPLPAAIAPLVASAWDDGYPLMLAVNGPDGPVMGPKGSMIVFDGDHLAFLERTRGAILDCLRRDPRVCVMYVNMKAQRDGKMESGFLRFFGTAELHESGPVREAIFAKLLAARADPCRRRQGHRRAHQDHQRRRHPRQAADVRRPGAFPSPHPHFPSPLAGEGGEHRSCEPGEGQRPGSDWWRRPLTRIANAIRPLPACGERCLSHGVNKLPIKHTREKLAGRSGPWRRAMLCWLFRI